MIKYCKVNETPGKGEKPPVLSLLRCYSTIFNNTRQDYLNKHMSEDGIDHGGHTMEAATAEACKAVATAQRDADVAYYEPLLKQAQQEIDYIQLQWDANEQWYEKQIQQARAEEREKVLDELKAGTVSVASLIEKARAEIAREIFEWGDEICEEHFMYNNKMYVMRKHCRKCWQSLKNRFLKEEK